MNPFINPYFFSKIVANYLADLNRLQKMNPKRLQKFRDKKIQDVVRHSYNVSLYYEKFKKKGLNPKNIKNIDDISKLPFITKQDLIDNYPDKIVSSSFNKKNSVISYTSGTTGKPVSIYFDMLTTIKALFGYIRVVREHGCRWSNDRLTIIVDLSEDSIESEYLTSWILPSLKPIFNFDNIQIFNTYDIAENIVDKINQFKPEYIVGYPGMLRHLAILKRKGYADNINPKKIVSCGSILDKSLEKYLEETFKTEIFDAYGAMESGPIAFQCKHKKYHLHSDFVHIELLDDKHELINSEKPGKIAITRLYGKATPIIRYTGLDDIITPTNEKCNCGLSGDLIKKIHGREKHSVVLPDGRILTPLTMGNFIGETSEEINIETIERFQIIQHKTDKVELIAGIKKEIKEKKVEKILEKMQENFKEKYEINLDIKIKDSSYFKPHTPGIIQKVDFNKITKKQYL